VEENSEMPDSNANKAQLGCGTLIVIALIVFFFSGRTQMDDQKRSIDELKSQVIVLQQKVDVLVLAIERQQATKVRATAMPSEQFLPAKGQ
jgi:hypothetical protein